MSDRSLILNLGHVFIAAAWADGVLGDDERKSLKDIIFQLPGLTGTEWAELERRADIPVGPEERDQLVGSLRNSMVTEDDRELVLSGLDELLRADSPMGPAERAALREIRSGLDSQRPSFWTGMVGMLRGSLERRVSAAATAIRPQQQLAEKLHDRLFVDVGRRLETESSAEALEQTELRRLCIVGGLMARVAHVDFEVSDSERGAMIDALRREWQLSDVAASAVVDIVVRGTRNDFDYHRAMREFFGMTAETERKSFLDLLFAVAAADGRVSHEEMEEIRLISIGLKLPHVSFIAAKTRVPSELRAH